MLPRPSAQAIQIGVSGCILGDEVRYDGAHKRDRFVTEVLGSAFQFVPVCPEVEVGMGVPRETVHLTGRRADPRLVGTTSGKDWTARMKRFAATRIQEAAIQDLCGFILKTDSPSCGMERVKVMKADGHPQKVGRGVFAAALIERMPLLPVEEEQRLVDLGLRENFIVRVFAYSRLQRFFAQRFSRRRVLAFHAENRSLLMAHSQSRLQDLDRLVARIQRVSPTEFRSQYRDKYMRILVVRSSTKKNVGVLRFLTGELTRCIEPPQQADLLSMITDYHRGQLPLIVPVSVLRHHFQVHSEDGLVRHMYLHPHPLELMLRNHA